MLLQLIYTVSMTMHIYKVCSPQLRSVRSGCSRCRTRGSCPAQLVALVAITAAAGHRSPACCHLKGCATSDALGEAIPLPTTCPDSWRVPIGELEARPRSLAYTPAEAASPSHLCPLTREMPQKEKSF